METTDGLFNPSLEAALKKLDPEDGEQILEYFKTHALLSREKALLQSSVRDQKKLLVENAKLKKDIEQLKTQLQDKQRRRTVKALFSPPPPTSSPTSSTAANQPPPGVTAAAPTDLPPSFSHERQNRRRRGDRRGGLTSCVSAPPTSDSLLLGEEPQVDVSRLDLRVGRILRARRHPLSRTLSFLEVDVGEGAARIVISKLGLLTLGDELQGALAVLLCNVKAYKMEGLISKARLLCCSSSDDVIELLVPPTGSTPGDKITFLNYPGDPDRELQSKQRVWELVEPELRVDGKGVANYKGSSFQVKGKGLCRAQTLTNCLIK